MPRPPFCPKCARDWPPPPYPESRATCDVCHQERLYLSGRAKGHLGVALDMAYSQILMRNAVRRWMGNRISRPDPSLA